MLYLLRDDFLGEERLTALRSSLGSADAQSLNTTTLDGQLLTLAELRAAAEALPFLGDRRLVVVRRLFGKPERADNGGDGAAARRGGRSDGEREQEFLTYFATIPSTTDLVLIEDRELNATHPVAKAISRLGGQVHLEAMPRWEELARWIEQRVRDKGGRIDQGAAHDLSALPIGDLRRLDSYLEVLVTYAAGQAITSAEVRLLVPQSHESNVFNLVDAVGARDRRAALEAYRRLLADNVSPVYLLVMLTRQVRLLLLTHEALGNREDVAAALKLHPRVAQKLAQQARNFGVERCLDAFQKLAAADQSIKTGDADEELALELLVIELTER